MRILLLLPWLFAQTGYSQGWEQLSDYPGTERDDGIAFVIDNKAYCGTGLSPWWAPFGDFYTFDLDSETWSAIAPLPEGEERQYATGFSDSEFGYLFGGLKGEFLNDFWLYDPENNVWMALPEPPASPRGGCAHFVIGDTAYIIGGKDDENAALAEVWAYDMNSETWTQKNSLPFGGRWRASATAHNDKGYLTFGWDESAEFQNGLYEYDPASDEWAFISIFPESGRTHSALQSVNGHLLVFGGHDNSSTAFGDLWQFDPETFEWIQLASIPAAGRRGGMAFIHNNQFYYTTGIDGDNNRLKETWKYQILTGLNEGILREAFVLFPNPATTSITIAVGLPGHSGPVRFTVWDAVGRNIASGEMGSKTKTLNTSDWPKGVYLVQLQSDKWIVGKQFAVE